MGHDSSAALLARAMADEKELFLRFAEKEAGLTRVVQERDWQRLEQSLADLERLAGDIEAAEQLRHRRFQELKQQLGVGDRTGFALVVSRIPESGRGRLVACHEELRSAVGRVRTLSSSLAYYFRYIKESVEQILVEAFPHRRGRIYSRHGRPAEAGADPVVINRSL
jgi:hypothetical protein